MRDKNPFGEDLPPARRANPFGEERRAERPAEAAERIDQAARKIRGLRSQLGAEGLSPAGMRSMIDEIATALEALSRALRGLEPE